MSCYKECKLLKTIKDYACLVLHKFFQSLLASNFHRQGRGFWFNKFQNLSSHIKLNIIDNFTTSLEDSSVNPSTPFSPCVVH